MLQRALPLGFSLLIEILKSLAEIGLLLRETFLDRSFPLLRSHTQKPVNRIVGIRQRWLTLGRSPGVLRWCVRSRLGSWRVLRRWLRLGRLRLIRAHGHHGAQPHDAHDLDGAIHP